ncbi:ABC transporter permease [candidate division KSB1 bacterium]
MDSKTHKIPRIFRLLIDFFTDDSDKAHISGDYEEIYNSVYVQNGKIRAYFWAIKQIINLALIYISDSLIWGVNMWKNYLKIAFRNMRKQKSYTVINVSGLAIGLACCILIMLWVQDELSYDRHHEKLDRIQQVVCNMNINNVTRYTASTPAPLSAALKRDFPEIEKVTMYSDKGSFNFKLDDKIFNEEGYGFAEKDFFDIFSFPLVIGDPETVFSDPYSIVLSEEMAKKYFNSENPLGKTLKIDNDFYVTVTGIMKNIPGNSTININFLSPFVILAKEYYGQDILQNWDRHSFGTFFLISDNNQLSMLKEKIIDYKRTFVEDTSVKFELVPMNKIHLYTAHISDSISGKGDIKYIYIFSALALIILLIACINYMNLMTSRISRRAKEIGIRKVSGANKRNVLVQFFGETILMTFLALFISVILAQIVLPVFNSLSAKNLQLLNSGNFNIFIWLVLIALLTGVFSALYPAILLATLQPVKILKGEIRQVSKGYNTRTLLVMTQFTFSIILIICAFVLSKQINFLKNKSLGYDKNHLITIRMPEEVRGRYDALKTELLQIPGIVNISNSYSPLTWKNTAISGLDWEGKEDEKVVEFWIDFVDQNYIETLDIVLISGRSFSEKVFKDSISSCLVNEEAVRQMGLESPVGKWIEFDDKHVEITGIMKNYNFSSLHNPIEPLILFFDPSRLNNVHVRISPDKISANLDGIRETWKKTNPDYPIDYYFVDEQFNRLYRTEEKINTIFRWSALLGIFISCLGLFGLASYIAQKRTKEVGIRKVLGASSTGIIVLMTKEFIKWSFLANIIAWPVAWYVLSRWLENFAYRTEIGWFIFVLSGIIALIITMAAVSFQTIKASISNPVDSLRYE